MITKKKKKIKGKTEMWGSDLCVRTLEKTDDAMAANPSVACAIVGEKKDKLSEDRPAKIRVGFISNVTIAQKSKRKYHPSLFGGKFDWFPQA